MQLLFDEDYEKLKIDGVTFKEIPEHRFFIFTNYPLPEGLYTVATCDVLVVIPSNYNQAGNDMLWTNPRLKRSDGQAIPRSEEPGSRHNQRAEEVEYCRWSRHWSKESPGAWRPGYDDIMSIKRRIDWALKYPDARKS